MKKVLYVLKVDNCKADLIVTKLGVPVLYRPVDIATFLKVHPSVVSRHISDGTPIRRCLIRDYLGRDTPSILEELCYTDNILLNRSVYIGYSVTSIAAMTRIAEYKLRYLLNKQHGSLKVNGYVIEEQP